MKAALPLPADAAHEGGEYAIEVSAVRLGRGQRYGGVLVVRRLPGFHELFRAASAERGRSYLSAEEALREALLEGQRFVRAEQLLQCRLPG